MTTKRTALAILLGTGQVGHQGGHAAKRGGGTMTAQNTCMFLGDASTVIGTAGSTAKTNARTFGHGGA
jgi:hypothetical protein